jgi:hypothetical protein
MPYETMKAMYNDVDFNWTERSSSVLAVDTNRINSPTSNGISDPEVLSNIIVGIPRTIRTSARYFE